MTDYFVYNKDNATVIYMGKHIKEAENIAHANPSYYVLEVSRNYKPERYPNVGELWTSTGSNAYIIDKQVYNDETYIIYRVNSNIAINLQSWFIQHYKFKALTK